jgi:hypothetical protein
VPPLTFASTGVALASVDDMVGPRTACRLRVGDEALTSGPRASVGEKGRRGERPKPGRAGPAHARERGGEEEGLGCGYGPKRREGRE